MNNNGERRKRSAGYLQIGVYNAGASYKYYYRLDRGHCRREGVGDENCAIHDHNFFTADFRFPRIFTDPAKVRSKLKVEYVCSSDCGTPRSTPLNWQRVQNLGPGSNQPSKFRLFRHSCG